MAKIAPFLPSRNQISDLPPKNERTVRSNHSKEIFPSNLLTSAGFLRALQLQPQYLSNLAQQYELIHQGEDFEIKSFAPLSKLPLELNSTVLTYLVASQFAQSLEGYQNVAVVTKSETCDFIPRGMPILLTEYDPHDIFYTIFANLVEAGHYEMLVSYRSPLAKVAPTAVIESNVYIDDYAIIGAGTVILSNTYVGRNCVVKPNATIGGDGFEVAVVNGRRKIIPHAGGVWLSENVEIGSSTCIDKGLFGGFTYLGKDTKVDNLVHIAHVAQIGNGCSLIACVEVSGSAQIEDGVWVGPNSTINQGLIIGKHSFIGTGSVVNRNVPSYSLTYGVPAKHTAYVCSCRTKLEFVQNWATCARCRTHYVLQEDKVVRVD